MAPAILIILFIFIGPFLSSIYISMTDWSGMSWNMNFIGLKNYINIFRDPNIGEVMLNNLKYLILLVFVQNLVAVILAVMVEECSFGKKFFRSVFFIPSLVASVAVGFIWTLMLDPINGSVPNLINMLHIDSLSHFQWLGDPNNTLYVIAFISIWQWAGWNMVIYIAGLQSIPKELYEASEIDGASWFARFRRITLPLLAPAITVNMVVSSIGALKLFDLPFIMTKGGKSVV